MTTLPQFTARPLDASDLDLVCVHRERMFREAGRSEAELAAMAAPFRAWLVPRLADGRYFGFAIDADGAPVAAIGLMEIDWPPHPLHVDDARRGYVLNLFVEPAVRGRGLARQLMAAGDAEFRRRGIRYAILHATDAGRPLYEQLGWNATSEMARTYR